MTISAAITAAAGCFYAQYFLFIDAGIAYGPWISVEALLAPIIGGVGTVFGPLLGALVVKTLGELTKLVTGDAPGLDLVIYGGVLILVVGVRAARHRRPASTICAACSAGCARWHRSAAMAEPLLRVESVSKRFGGLLAVDRPSFTAEAGRITALIGPNGAGKTTLFSIISGFLPPSRRPHRLRRRRHHRRAAAPAGAARHRAHLPDRAAVRRPDGAREHRGRRASLSRPARADALAAAAKSRDAVGLGALLDRPAAALTVAGRKRLELARALAIEPRLLLLDEVLAGLNPSEIRDMVPVIRAIADRGVTIVMIEHVMQAVMSLAEHVFVLSEGRIIAEGTPQAIAGDPRVVEAYLGHGAAQPHDRRSGPGDHG